MTRKRAQGWARLVGILTFLSLVGNWATFAPAVTLSPGSQSALLPLLFLGLGLVTAWALITDRWWGFWGFYAYAGLGLLLLSLVLIPSVPGLFPEPLRLWVGVLINGALLALAVRTQLALAGAS